MQYYLAPMEGITGYVYRNAYHAYFYPMDKYFTPFLSPGQEGELRNRDVQEILPEKISLGIPNYGYDWPLPYERGVTRARTLSHSQALQLAIDFGAEIHFDETAQSPWFRYWQYGIQHEVWFEDVRSYKAKFDLIKE